FVWEGIVTSAGLMASLLPMAGSASMKRVLANWVCAFGSTRVKLTSGIVVHYRRIAGSAFIPHCWVICSAHFKVLACSGYGLGRTQITCLPRLVWRLWAASLFSMPCGIPPHPGLYHEDALVYQYRMCWMPTMPCLGIAIRRKLFYRRP